MRICFSMDGENDLFTNNDVTTVAIIKRTVFAYIYIYIYIYIYTIEIVTIKVVTIKVVTKLK